jgi:multidrug efflux pump subunit AcrA (membrane-fusion protein)
MSTEPNSNDPNVEPAGKPTQAPAPPLPKPASKWWTLIGFIAFLVVGLVLAYYIGIKPAREAEKIVVTAIRTETVSTGNLERSIRVGGTTSSIVFTNVRAPVQSGPERQSLILLELLPSGTRVKKGDIVARIDGQSLKDHIDDTQTTVDASLSDIKKRYAEHRVDYNNLEQDVRVAESNAEKWALEAKAGEIRTVIDREILKLGEEEAAASYAQRQKDLDFKKDVHDAEVKILGYTTERHKRHVGRHAFDLERFTVEAPMDGMVVRQQIFRNGEFGMAEVGDRLFPGLLFVKVMDTDNMQIEAQINQAESHEFKIGMKAKVGLDAFPGLELTGTVYSIGALAKAGTQGQYVRNIPLMVRVNGSHQQLIPDLSGYADVVLEEAENVIQVPLAAVFAEQGQDYVYVKTGASFEKRPVRLGLRNFTHAEVLDGLNAGEEVALESPIG